MQLHFGADLLNPEWPSSVVCIGTFDGVHLGHRKVIERLVELAHEHEEPSVLVTFDRHPASVLAPERVPPAIASTAQNLKQFGAMGVSVAVVLPFTYELSQTPAHVFFEGLLLQKLKAREIVVGHDFAFGKDRQGTPEWLSQRITTHTVPPFQADGVRVSSSQIRSLIKAGQMAPAAKLLGRAWSMQGVVVAGQKLGRTLGYPTINLVRSAEQILPPDGIYAGQAETVHGLYRAAISIGLRPTVGGQHRTIEAFLLDYPGHSLYGTAVELSFSTKLRDEMKFESLELLTQQMARDVSAVEMLEV
jgi:riboflavin kinase/FMN adenylyltransferase